MKKAKLNQKLNFKKEHISNLNTVKGGSPGTVVTICKTSIDFGVCVSIQLPCYSDGPFCHE